MAWVRQALALNLLNQCSHKVARLVSALRFKFKSTLPSSLTPQENNIDTLCKSGKST